MIRRDGQARPALQILWLSPYVPAPTSGAGTRVFNLLTSLSGTCAIDLIAGAVTGPPSPESVARMRRLCRTVQVETASARGGRAKRLLQLWSTVSIRPMHYRIFYSSAMQNLIDNALAKNTYDVVILESAFMGYFSLASGPKVVLDQHNVESEILKRSGYRERSLVRRLYNLVEYRKVYPAERHICRNADLILATSDRDRDTMLRWSNMPQVEVIPNGVDTSYFTPVAEEPCRPTVVFTGTMSYAPNAEAMLSFVSHVWPLVVARCPDAALRIVGQNPPPEIQALTRYANVSVLGAVPDIRPHLAEAQVVIAPLRIGGGTRLKILEALAMRRAVVSTSIGCEGLAAKDGTHLLVADSETQFADGILELLNDPVRRCTLGREGRRLVEQQYDWLILGERLKSILLTCCEADDTGALGSP